MKMVPAPHLVAVADCLDDAKGSLDSWAARLGNIDLPVLRQTARRLTRLAANDSDSLGPRDIANVVMRDPLMTAKLYMHAKRILNGRQLAEITTVDRIIVMLGVPPFLRAFSSPPLIEEWLQGNRPALEGFLRVMRRARHAANIAGMFAARRNDSGFEEIMISALLHDLVEMLL